MFQEAKDAAQGDYFLPILLAIVGAGGILSTILAYVLGGRRTTEANIVATQAKTILDTAEGFQQIWELLEAAKLKASDEVEKRRLTDLALYAAESKLKEKIEECAQIHVTRTLWEKCRKDALDFTAVLELELKSMEPHPNIAKALEELKKNLEFSDTVPSLYNYGKSN